MTSWKETLNQAEEANEAKIADRIAKEQAEQAQANKEAALEGKVILEQILGVQLPDADKPSWELDGYHFSFATELRSNNYNFKTLFLQKSVANSKLDFINDDEFDDDFDSDFYGYRLIAHNSLALSSMPVFLEENRVRLATCLRELDADALRFEEHNQQVKNKYLANQVIAEPQPEPVAPKPRIQIMSVICDPVAQSGDGCILDVSTYVNDGWQIISTHYGQSPIFYEGHLTAIYTMVFVLQRTVYDLPTPPEPEKVAVTPEYANVTEPITIETPAEPPAGEEDEQPEEVVILNPQMTIVQPTNPELLKLTEKLPNARRILEVGIDTFREEQNAEVADAVLARLAISQNTETFQALTTSRPLGGQLPAPLFSEN